MKPIKLFFAKIRRMYFNWRINREIFHKIAPHLRNDGDYGYPFHSDAEMVRMHVRGNLHAGLNLRLIGNTAAKMPKFQGDAFRYLIYRDLNERMEMYLEMAEQCVQPETFDPQFVTTPA